MKNKIKIVVISIIQIIGILLLSYLFEKIIEVLIIIPLFFIFRKKYTKTYHARTLFECTLYTLLLFLVICLVAQPVQISILLVIILCYITTEILYLIKDYQDLIKVKKFKIYKGMNKQLLVQKCQLYELTDLETQVLVLYYCGRLKRWQIGNILNYSEDNISKIKEKALNKFKIEL